MANGFWRNFALFLAILPLYSLAQDCVGSCKCSSFAVQGKKYPEKIVNCSSLSLSTVPTIPSETTQLFLGNNQILELDVNAFKSAPNLWKIDVSKNKLQTVPKDIFKFNPKIYDVNFANNPLLCGCKLHGLHNISQHVNTFKGSCASPLQLANKELKALRLDEFCGGCLGIKLSGKGSTDGEYYIKLTAKCEGYVRVYCSGMSNGSPKEYLSLQSGITRNYALISDYKQPEVAKNLCDRKPGGSVYNLAGQSNFTKVRIVVAASGVSIKNDDFLYALTTGKEIPLGVAGDCYSASSENCRKGRFRIDLTGTGFRFKDTVHWEHYGTPINIQSTLDIDIERRVVYGECGGYCGGCRPQGSLELELNTCPEEGIKPCLNTLGMDDRSIGDAQITGSSHKPNYEPSNGRLNNIKTASKGGSWCAQKSDTHQYLQIDLKKQMTYSGIVIQGSGETQDWVTKYKIQKSDDGVIFQDHTEFGMPVEYPGNIDNFNSVTNWFSQRFRSRYVRIVPTEWNSAICLRVELYGCDNDIVSVAIRHKTDLRCWSPSVDQCSIQDGTSLVIKPSCNGEREMFIFLKDNTIKHTCSGKCVFVDSSDKLSLRDSPCDGFLRKKVGDAYQVIHEKTKRCLHLSNVKTGELSMASCGPSSAMFEFTQDSISPISPKITVAKTYLTVDEPAWVHCKVIADPRAQIYWSKLRPWPTGVRLSKLEFLEWSNGSLYVRNARLSYTGRYYCSAANTADFVFGYFDIIVGSAPKMLTAPNDTKVILNRTAVLNCVLAVTNIPTKIVWYKKSIRDPTLISVDKLDHRYLVLSNRSLKIDRVETGDEAYYSCQARNPLGSVNGTAFLKVMIPPSFYIFPKDIEIPSSSSRMLSCKGVGVPPPRISWTRKNGSALPKNAKVYSNGSLFLREIKLEDQGNYICTATNDAGTIHTEVSIKVYGACRIDSIPFASHTPNQIFFPVGHVVFIKCERGYQMKEGLKTNMTCISDGTFDKALPKCKDINECRVDPATDENNLEVTTYHSCDKNALCMNTIGSYRCECSDGFKGDGFTCAPLCPRPNNPTNSIKWTPHKTYYDNGEMISLTCVNGYETAPSTSATCNETGQFDLLPTCQDINECSKENACPDKNTMCKNLAGSYRCDCKQGLEDDGRGGCEVPVKRRWKTSHVFALFLIKMKRFTTQNASSLMILETLANETAAYEGRLTSGDLLVIYDTLRSVQSKADQPGSQQTKEREMKAFFKVCSRLLAKENKKEWKNIQKEGKGVTNVMLLVEDYISAMSDSVLINGTSSLTMHNENLNIQVEARQANTLYSGHRYPDNNKHSRVQVPGEVFQSYESGSQVIRITGVTYKTLAMLLPNKADGVKSFDVASTTIVSTSLQPKPAMQDGKLASPVNIVLNGEKITQRDSTPKCVFWDFKKNSRYGGSWSSEGCRVVSSSSNSTVCECDHMTTFASLAVYDKPLVFTLVVYIAIGILLLVVLILILRHLYLYCKLKSERSIIHLNLCFAIGLAFGLFLGTLTLTTLKIVCIVTAALLHYFIMAMFCWIISKCLQIYQTLTTGKNRNSKRLKWFYFIGWFLPALTVGISLGVFRLAGYGNREWCWLDYSDMVMWAYAGPAAFFLFITLLLIVICSIIKARVVDSSDKTKVSISLAMAMLLGIAIACTWVAAAIYVRHHQEKLWEYVFAGSCVLQAIILLLFGVLDKEIKNFSFIYQIKKIQQKEHKEKRNYYSTTDTVQYYGAANAPDGKTYTVTRPSTKESTQDLRGSSKRLSRIGSAQEVSESYADYPPPIVETPGQLDESYRRKVENQPLPYTPSFPNSEVIQLQTFPARRGHLDYSPKSSDRQPDGAEYPEPLSFNDGHERIYRSGSPRSPEGLSDKLAQIPERAPLMRDYREDEASTINSDFSLRDDEKPTPIYTDSVREPLTSGPSRLRSERSRARLEERYKMDMDSIKRRKRKLRYSSGYLIGATIDDNRDVTKDHASL